MSSVYSWGAGTSGQLGNGALQDEHLPTLVPELSGKKAVELACGGSHVAAVLDDGSVLVWGSQPTEESDTPSAIASPRPLPSLADVRVVKAAAGWAHTAFITNHGKVFTYGEGQYGQLGVGSKEPLITPTEVTALAEWKAIDVACGLRHTLVLLKGKTSTKVFAFGAGKRGQLGVSPPISIAEHPVGVESLDGFEITSIEAAGNHSAAISATGDLLSWGRGFLDVKDMHVPIPIGYGRRWGHVALGWNHGLALTESGQLWSWGSNRYGQLGVGGTSSTGHFTAPVIASEVDGESVAGHSTVPITASGVPGGSISGHATPSLGASGLPGDCTPGQLEAEGVKLQEVPFFSGQKVVSIAAGAEHSAGITESGDAFTWGWGEHGQLGLGHTQDCDTPQLVTVGIRSKQRGGGAKVYCGSGFTFAVLQPA